MPELPDDNWHTHIFVSLACYCDYPECNAEADLEWAWEGLTADGTPNAARVFTIRAVEYLKREGWQMLGNYETYCPKCVAKRAKNPSD